VLATILVVVKVALYLLEAKGVAELVAAWREKNKMKILV
jgi:hypothetical protein